MTLKSVTKRKQIQKELPLNGDIVPRFWQYDQNNSGSSFVQDHNRGLSCHVIIEAESAKQADTITESIGIYFKGCSIGQDCNCCDDRWCSAYGEGDVTPKIYSKAVSKGSYKDWHGWMKDRIEGYIHYLNGKVKPVKLIKVPYDSKS